MDGLTPAEIIEQLDAIIESLTEMEGGYTALDMAYRLKDEVIEAFDVITDE